jgi:hypothetical protein
MARNAETGVSKSALTDFTTGTSVASRASRENCLKSGCSIVCDPVRRFGGIFIIRDARETAGSLLNNRCSTIVAQQSLLNQRNL